jgi:hypothetical protein
METHSLSRIERPEGADGGPETIGRFRHHHQAFAFHLSLNFKTRRRVITQKEKKLQKERHTMLVSRFFPIFPLT